MIRVLSLLFFAVITLSALNAKSYNYEIHFAVRSDNIDILKHLLVQYKEFINEKDQFGFTPLHLAVRKNDTQMVKYILGENPRVDTTDDFGDTPLIDGARNNNMDIVKLLICKGADKTIKNNENKSVMDFISLNKQYDAALFMQNPKCEDDINVKQQKLVEKLRKLE